MSANVTRQVLTRLSATPAMIAPNLAQVATHCLEQLASADTGTEQAKEPDHLDTLAMAYSQSERDNSKPFVFVEGVAVIPVHGLLINRFGGYWGFVTGYNYIRRMVTAAVLDGEVEAVILDIDSPGGEAAGCFELSSFIREMATEKPIYGLVDSSCYSAAYAIGSACTELIVTPSGGAGSIGVVRMHIDMSKYLEGIGFDISFIHGGAHKVDGNPYEPLPEDVKAEWQGEIDAMYADFAELVAQNRGIDVKVVLDTEARCYRAEKALEIGLIDRIESSAEALVGILTDSEEPEALDTDEEDMRDMSIANKGAKPENAKPTADAAVEGAEATTEEKPTTQVSERARINAILRSEDGMKNPTLADHLAFETDLTVEQASAILAASAPKAEASTSGQSPLDLAMGKEPAPGIQSDLTADEAAKPESELSDAASILQCHAAFTGAKHKTH